MANVYTNHKLKLTTTNATTLYTVPSQTTAIVKSLRVTNVDSSNDCTVTVTVTDTSSVEFTLETSRNVEKASSEELFNSFSFSTSPVVLKESEIVKLQAQNANDLHAILSVLEIS